MKTPRESIYVIAVGGGRYYDLVEPNPEIFEVREIATVLARLPRFNAWNRGDYSVGLHSVIGAKQLLAEGAGRELAREFLWHDAHEVVTGDMLGPIKWTLRDVFGSDAWERFERGHRRAFARWFGLPLDVSPEVRAMDTRMLTSEAARFFAAEPAEWGLTPVAPISVLGDIHAAAEFIRLNEELS